MSQETVTDWQLSGAGRRPRYNYLVKGYRLSKNLARARPVQGRLVNRVARYRLKRNITQATLAELCGVSRKTINGIETNRTQPTLQVALRLASVFGVKVEELFRLD